MKSAASETLATEQTWESAIEALALGPVAAMLEDHATALAKDMLGGEAACVERAVWMGLPVFAVAGAGALVELSAPGEGGGIEVTALLAGLAITAHAAEYLYFGSDPRFATAQKVKAYKYLVQAEALRSAGCMGASLAAQYEELLGLEW
jgi:hypothetical protein